MPDIYLRVEGDPNFIPSQIELFDELDILLGQIEMILFTRKGDVLSDYTLGANLEDYIFSLGASEAQLETVIRDQIQKYAPASKYFNVQTEVRFFSGSERDIAVIDIVVNGARLLGLVIT